MNNIVIGNVICLIAATFMIAIGFLKTKRNILIVQNLQCGFFALGNLFLGGYSGVITNLVSIVRNVYSFKFDFNLPAKIIFCLLQVVLGVFFNNRGIIGFLPIIACVIFTWYLDTTSDKIMKIVVISTTVLWTIYDFSIYNFTAFCLDISALVANGVGMFRILRDEKKAK